MNGLNTSKQDDGAYEFFRTYRKLRAIDRIKAQPFYGPRDNFYDGLQWYPEQIDRLRERDKKPLILDDRSLAMKAMLDAVSLAEPSKVIVAPTWIGYDLNAEMTEANRIISERMNG